MDIVSKEKRSRVMARVRSKDTKPERAVRSALHKHGFRFRLHRADLPGKPDIVLPARRAAIFVHGCFWHSHENCVAAKIPSSNREYWQPKLRRNVQRDRLAQAQLIKMGWAVRVVWGCELANAARREATIGALTDWLISRQAKLERHRSSLG
jgi:DNA mismatch endonuclease (patch repair protein)